MEQHNPQNSSLHLFLGLPLGLFPATCPFITLFARLPSFSIIFSLHNSLLLFICATTASCFNLSLIASFTTHSNLVTPTTLLRTFISAACNLVLSLSFNTHVSQTIHQGWYYHCIVHCHLGFIHCSTPYSRRPFFSGTPLLLLLYQSSSPIHSPFFHSRLEEWRVNWRGGLDTH